MSCHLNVIWLRTAQRKKKTLPDKMVRYDERLPCWLCCLPWDWHRGFFFFHDQSFITFLRNWKSSPTKCCISFLPPQAPSICSRLWSKLCSRRFQGCMRLIIKKELGLFFFTYCNNFDSRAQMVFCFIKARLIFQEWFDWLGSRSPSSYDRLQCVQLRLAFHRSGATDTDSLWQTLV